MSILHLKNNYWFFFINRRGSSIFMKKKSQLIFQISLDVWHVDSQPKVRPAHNFSTSRYNKNLKKITHIKYVKNIYFAW